MCTMPTHYELFNILSTADDVTVKRAYYKLALLNHPDKTIHLNPAERSRREKLFKDANTAFEILSDVLKRAAYDRRLRARAQVPAYTSSTWQTASAHAETKRKQERDQNSYQYKNRAPRPPPPKHPLSSGCPPETWDTDPNVPWFFAPVSETPERTMFDFSNHHGWHFNIGVAKHFKFTLVPMVSLWIANTSKQIVIKIYLARQQCNILFLKDVVLNVHKSPGSRQTALSSIFAEKHNEGIELRITLAINDEKCAAPSWTWAFDADFGFLAPMYKAMRVTHQMFWPIYPSHAIGLRGEAPVEPFPEGLPMAYLKQELPGMGFVEVSRGFYCKEQIWAGKKLWRVVAVGIV